jgi:hypothetical protein
MPSKQAMHDVHGSVKKTMILAGGHAAYSEEIEHARSYGGYEASRLASFTLHPPPPPPPLRPHPPPP